MNLFLKDKTVYMHNQLIKNKADYRYGKSIRYMLQTLGTEWGRNLIHPDIWILEAERRLKQMSNANDTDGVIITDCRFPNEADKIHEMGGKVIRIVRPNNPLTATVNSVGVGAAHLSEQGLSSDKIDYTIINDNSPNQMLDSFLKFLDTL